MMFYKKKSLHLKLVSNFSIFVTNHGVPPPQKKKVFIYNQSWFFKYNVLKIPDGMATQ